MSSPEVKDGKRWTGTRKAEVVLALLKGAEVAEVCRKNGVNRLLFIFAEQVVT